MADSPPKHSLVLNPLIGSTLLPDITLEDIERVIANRRAHGAGNRYANMTIETLRLILRRNQCWEPIRKDYKKLKEPKSVGKELSYEEEERLFQACHASISRGLYVVVALALYGGLRRSEIKLLRWSNVDLEKDCLTVGASKTEAGEGRLVPLIGPALNAVKEWAKVFPNRHPDDFVFPSEKYATHTDNK